MQFFKNHVTYTNVSLWISFFFILFMLLSTIGFSCYPTICVKMKFMYVCICFLYVFGKYNWGNVVSILFNRILQRRKVWSGLQESKLRSFKMGKTSSKFVLLETGSELAKSGLCCRLNTSLTPKNFFRSNFDSTLESRNLSWKSVYIFLIIFWKNVS